MCSKRLFVYKITNIKKDLPLWMPRYDGLTNNEFFGPFAEWTNVYMKQMTGGSTQARRIGSDRIYNDYLPLRPWEDLWKIIQVSLSCKYKSLSFKYKLCQ